MKEKIIKLLNTRQTLVWITLTIVLSLALIALVIIPQFQSYLATNNDIEVFNTKTNSLNTKLSSLQDINLEKYKGDLNLALAALPAESDLIPAINQVQLLISNNNLQLNDISFSGITNQRSSADTTDATSFRINIDVTGEASTILSFLSDINEAPRIMKLNNLDIGADRRANFYTSTMTLQVFYHPLPTSLGNIDQPIALLTAEDQKILQKINEFISSLPSTSFPTTSTPKGRSNPFE